MSYEAIKLTRAAKKQQDTISGFLLRSMAMTLIMVLSSRAVIPIPGTPVPLTLQVFGLFAGALFMGPAESALGMLLYVLLGAMGFGVFANQASIAQLGVGTGYVAGMVMAAPVIGMLRRKINYAWAAMTGLTMIYASGVAYLCITTHTSVTQALVIGVLPFVLPDLIKLGFAAVIIGYIKR